MYKKVGMGAFYEWFTARGKLKPHLKEAIAKGIASIPTHFSILETRLELKDEFINVLKNMQTTKQGFYAPLVEPIIRRIFECWTLKV